jgi:uncharacterized membrane protein YfcA
VALLDTRFDRAALRAGGSVALVFAVPCSIAARWAADSRDDSALAVLLSLGAVAGFVLGAGVAAWVQQRGLPLSHGMVTAAVTYTAAQLVFVLVRLVAGKEVHWFAVLFNLSVAVGAGLLGGYLGQTLHRRGFTPSSSRRAGGRGAT